MHQTTGAGGAALLNALIMVDLRACAFELLHRDAAADTAFGAEAALKATVRRAQTPLCTWRITRTAFSKRSWWVIQCYNLTCAPL